MYSIIMYIIIIEFNVLTMSILKHCVVIRYLPQYGNDNSNVMNLHPNCGSWKLVDDSSAQI